MSNEWVVYDPETDQFVRFVGKNFGGVGVEVWNLDWQAEPVYYPQNDLFEIISNLGKGQLRAVWDAHIVPSQEKIQYEKAMVLLEWYEDELNKRGVHLDIESIKCLKL